MPLLQQHLMFSCRHEREGTADSSRLRFRQAAPMKTQKDKKFGLLGKTVAEIVASVSTLDTEGREERKGLRDWKTGELGSWRKEISPGREYAWRWRQ